jgi:hypothetical protein
VVAPIVGWSHYGRPLAGIHIQASDVPVDRSK